MGKPPPLPETDSSSQKRIPKLQTVLLFFVAAPFALFVFTLVTGLTKQYKIPTGAMKPNLPPGTLVMAEKVSLFYSAPQRGDVIVFNTKDIEGIMRYSERPQMYIKRLIGMPGDTLEVQNGTLLINNEPYIVPDPDGNPLVYTNHGNLEQGKTFTVPEGTYFMMGDNSVNSSDSRSWGPMPEDAIRYRYWFTYYRTKQKSDP